MGKSKDLATGETRFVNTAGDSMTGALTGTSAGFTGDVNIGNNDSSNPLSKLRLGGTQYGAADIRPTDEGGHKVGMAFYTDGTGDTTIDPVLRMTIDNEGRVTKPNQPHLLAMGYKERYGTTDRHLFKTITTNTGNHWNNVNGKFTCPVDGNYLVTAFSGYKDSTTHAGIGIGYNGSVLSYGWSLSSDRHTQQSCTTIKSASANDYFYYYAHTSYTTPINSTGNEHHSHFSIYLLG